MAALVRKNPSALADLAAKAADGNYKLKVGFLKGFYPDGTPIAAVAAWNEFGVPWHNQPARPFFRRMIVAQSGKWPRMAATLMKGNGMDVPATLDVIGQEIVGRIQESINTLVDPPLAASTVLRKGHDKPLIDTSLMVKSPSYEVVKE